MIIVTFSGISHGILRLFIFQKQGPSSTLNYLVRDVRKVKLFSTFQASTLTQNDTGPVGPATPSICWSSKICTCPTFFLLHNRKEHCIKFTTTFIFIDFIFIHFKNIWGHSRWETFKQKCLQMLTGPVGPVEVFFYWPEAVLGIFTGLGP